MSTMKSVNDAANSDKEIRVWEEPEMMFDNYGRRIWVDGSNSGVEDGFKVGRHGVVVQVRGA